MVVKQLLKLKIFLTKLGKASKVKTGKRKQVFLASFKLTTHLMMEMKVSWQVLLSAHSTSRKS